MTSLESADVSLEARLALQAHRLLRDSARRKDRGFLGRALEDGRLRAALIALAAVGVAVVAERGVVDVLIAAPTFALVWILSVRLAESSLRTVSVVAGRSGVATFGALGGFVAVSALASWYQPVAGHQRAGIAGMAAFVFAITLGCELMKSRVAALRSSVLLVGDGPSAHDVIEVLAHESDDRFSVVGMVGDDSEAGIGGVPVVARLDALQQAVEALTPDLVVVSVDRGRPEVFAQLAGVAGLGFRVVGVPEFYEHAFARVPVWNMTDAWFMSILHLYQRPYTKLAKRSFDIAVALALLFITAPLFIVIAAFVRRTGPVFYRQTRLGDQGIPFTIFKFRTMRVDAESGGAVWAQHGDPRTTEVGRMLRRLRLDELPQLINVLRGDMAIVGPRPERPEFFELLEESVPFWSRRLLLKPGITGWAQLRAGYASDSRSTQEKLAYDLWYLRHQSLVVDLMICARTVPLVLLGAGR
jgi:exopolysaccharide biosynthesis polyprenyl glycosylphosphotransferase